MRIALMLVTGLLSALGLLVGVVAFVVFRDVRDPDDVAEVTGLVTGPDGLPVPGLMVELLPPEKASPGPYTPPSLVHVTAYTWTGQLELLSHQLNGRRERLRRARYTRTGPDGRYRLGPAHAVRHSVKVWGNATLATTRRDVALAAGTTTLDLALSQPQELSGRVVDQDGRPVELGIWFIRESTGAEVKAERTSPRGEFRVELEPGCYTLRAYLDGARAERTGVTLPARGLELILQPLPARK